MKLEDYAKLVVGKTCRMCGAKLPAKIEHYPHPDGWEVEGFDLDRVNLRAEPAGYF